MTLKKLLFPEGMPQMMFTYTVLPCGIHALHLASTETQLKDGYEPVHPPTSYVDADRARYQKLVSEHLFHGPAQCSAKKEE